MDELLERRSLKNNIDLIRDLVGDVKVVYTDVDGTLVGPRGSLFATPGGGHTLAAAEAIILAKEKGVDIVMVSGRSARQLFGDARLMGLSNYIAEMGCEIVYGCGDEIVENYPNAKEVGASLYETIAASGAIELLFGHYNGRLEYHTPWSKGRNCTHVFRGLIDTDEAGSLLKEEGYEDLKIIDNGVIGRRGSLDESLEEIHAYHLMPKATSKASGVARDMEIRGMDRTSAVAIGDAVSDIAMAEHVGAFFLVRNALNSRENAELEKEVLKYDNVFVTRGEMGEGFAEAVRLVCR